MHRLLVAIVLVSTQALADTYVCETIGRRTVSSSPCGAGEKTIKAINEAPVAAGPANSQSQTDNFRQQLRNVQQNRADLDARVRGDRPDPPMAVAEVAKPNKQQACESYWQAIRSIDAAARQYSTDWHRAEKKRLQDERWNLGC